MPTASSSRRPTSIGLRRARSTARTSKELFPSTGCGRQKMQRETRWFPEVSYKDGIVHFTSDGTEGNTVLAAFDAKGEVIWSWHLWMTDQPELFAYDEGGELMDRNLGATSALEADGAASFGLLYQWGRKDPFYGGEKNEDSGDGVFLRARNRRSSIRLMHRWHGSPCSATSR